MLNFKKIFSLSLATVMIATSMSVPTFAADYELDVTPERMKEAQHEINSLDIEQYRQEKKLKDSSSKNYTVSEYELLINLDKQSDFDLSKKGISKAEIDEIRNFRATYKKKIEELSLLNSYKLSDLGYTTTQIDTIKDFSGTDAEMMALSATCNVNVDIDYTEYDTSTQRTYSRLYFEFDWIGVPFVKLTDIMAVGWENWIVTGKTGNVKYNYINNSNTTKWVAPSFVASSNGVGQGGGYRFAASIDDNYYYADEGYCIFVVDSAQRRDMHTTAAYGHSTYSLTPNFSVSGSGVSLGISITGGYIDYKDSESRAVVDR